MAVIFTRTFLILFLFFVAGTMGAQIQFKVISPEQIAGIYNNYHPSDWGGRVESLMTLEAVLVNDGSTNPELGCLASDVGAYTGKAVFIRRGDCQFGAKTLNAEMAGAELVVIVNNIDGDPPVMAPADFGSQVTIPVFSLTLQDGNKIIDVIKSGETVNIAFYPAPFSFRDAYYPVSYTSVPNYVNRERIDSMGVVVANTTRSDLSNVIVTYEFLNKSTGEIIASDETFLINLTAETSFSAEWDLSANPISLEDLPHGDYAFRYSAHYMGDPFSEPGEYNITNDFRITNVTASSATWAHENGVTIGLRPGAGGDHADASLYYVPEGAEGLKAMTVSWASSNNVSEIDMAGSEVIIFLAELVAEQFDNSKDIYDPSQFELRGYAEYRYADESQRRVIVTVPLLDIDTDENGVSLKPDTEYWVVTVYSGPNNVLFHGYSEAITYPPGLPLTTNLVYTDSWVRYVRENRVVTGTSRMGVSYTNSVKPTTLEHIHVKMMPNPATDYIQLNFSFDVPEDLNMIITDMQGNVIRMINYKGVLDEQIQISLKDVLPGNYIVQINTKRGRAAEKFTLIR